MQTAVEWLVKNYLDLSDEYNTMSLEEIVKQAKEMEKQQIIDAYANAVMKENNSDYVGMHEQSSGEIYFDETYGSKGSDETKTDNI